MEDILLSVSSPPELDLEIFVCWIEGKSIEESATHKIEKCKKYNNCLGLEFPAYKKVSFIDTTDIINLEVIDQFRAFQVLEHYLANPTLLREQSLCTIMQDHQRYLIDKYWSLDDIFVRELLSKRLTKSRKDLEDASEQTGLTLRRVTRQFDNIKRMYTAFEDNLTAVDTLLTFIHCNFLLGPSLAKKYCCILFLLYSKFNLTAKRRIQRVSCESLEACAALIMVFLSMDTGYFLKTLAADNNSELILLENNHACWAFVWKHFGSISSLELDKQLLLSLRDVRSMLTGELLDSGCNSIKTKLGTALVKKLDGSWQSSSSKLRTIVKSLLQLGANLSQSREYRDMFEDIIGKVAEPLEESGFSLPEMTSFLSCCYHLVGDMAEARPPRTEATLRTDAAGVTLKNSKVETLKKDWMRFIAFCRLCLIQLVGSDRRAG